MALMAPLMHENSTAWTTGREVLVLNQETLCPEQEPVQDLLTIVHCFSSRLYVLRNYRKQLNEALKSDATSAQDTAQSDG